MSAQPLGEYFKDQEERRRSLHVLKANIHQGDPIFRENAGKQCTCNCLIFLIFAYTTHLQNVNARSLDNILKEGSSLYSKTSKMHGQEYIMVKELEGTSLFQKQYYQTTILSEHTGLCVSNEEFKNAIDIAFGISSYIFLYLGMFTEYHIPVPYIMQEITQFMHLIHIQEIRKAFPHLMELQSFFVITITIPFISIYLT